jgi:hypothetical protein
MDEQKIYWVKDTLCNNDDASDEEIRAYLIEGGLTEDEADEWVAKRIFYLNHMVVQEDQYSDIGIWDPKTRSVQSLTS